MHCFLPFSGITKKLIFGIIYLFIIKRSWEYRTNTHCNYSLQLSPFSEPPPERARRSPVCGPNNSYFDLKQEGICKNDYFSLVMGVWSESLFAQYSILEYRIQHTEKSRRWFKIGWHTENQLPGTTQSGWKERKKERKRRRKGKKSVLIKGTYTCNRHQGWRLQAAWTKKMAKHVPSEYCLGKVFVFYGGETK